MSKKVTNIIKKGKHSKSDEKSDEIFNLNEEIIIGINSKKSNSKKEKDKINVKKNKEYTENKNNMINKENIECKKNSITKGKPHLDRKNKENNVNSNEYVRVKNNKWSYKVLKIVIIIFLLILVFVILLLSPVFNIQKITIKNNNNVSEEAIINLSGIKLGDNIFKYINYELIQNIKANSYIKDVTISRKYPSEIIIDVTERTIAYYIKIDENYTYIDSQGYIIGTSSTEYHVPGIKGFKTEFSGNTIGKRIVEEDWLQLQKIIEISDQIKNNEMEDKVLGYRIMDNGIAIELVGEKTAYIEKFTNLNIKILSLKVILEKTVDKPGEIYLDGQGEKSNPLFREKV